MVLSPWILLIAFVTSTFGIGIKEKYVAFEEDMVEDGSALTLHAYPEKSLYLSGEKDGADIFEVKPGVNGKEETLSLLSVKYPNYYVHANQSTNMVKLEKLGSTSQQLDDATLTIHEKVSTKRETIRLFNFAYNFICAGNRKPYKAYVGTDDDSPDFAVECSFKKRFPSENELQVAKNGVSLDEASVQILIPKSSASNANIHLGLKADMFKQVRVGSPPDPFKVVQPGLAGMQGTISFESIRFPTFFLNRKGRDFFLEPQKNTAEFYNTATFNLEEFIDKPAKYYIHPFEKHEFSVGRVHSPPFFIRTMFNNNTEAYDKDTMWTFRYDKLPNSGLPSISDSLHQTLLKLLALNSKPLSMKQSDIIDNSLHGKIDLSLLGNASAILSLLTSSHMESLLKNQEEISNSSIEQSILMDSKLSDPVPVETEKTVEETHEAWSNWSPCPTTCNSTGSQQSRIRPCQVQLPTCTPLEQTQPCLSLPPCSTPSMLQHNTPMMPLVSPQAPAPVSVVTVPAVTTQPIWSAPTPCPPACSMDCNPVLCPLTCCNYQVKKSKLMKAVGHIQEPHKKVRSRVKAQPW